MLIGSCHTEYDVGSAVREILTTMQRGEEERMGRAIEAAILREVFCASIVICYSTL